MSALYEEAFVDCKVLCHPFEREIEQVLAVRNALAGDCRREILTAIRIGFLVFVVLLQLRIFLEALLLAHSISRTQCTCHIEVLVQLLHVALLRFALLIREQLIVNNAFPQSLLLLKNLNLGYLCAKAFGFTHRRVERLGEQLSLMRRFVQLFVGSQLFQLG